MERKDYEDKFRDIKNEILKEIRELIPSDSVHYFSDTFYSHYIDGEVATTEICAAVEVDQNEMVIFHVRSEGCKTTEMVVGEEIFKYSSDTFLDILDHLQKEVRKEKLEKVKDFAQKEGMVWFGEDDYISLSIADGKLSAKRQYGKYTPTYIMTDEDIDEELDSIITYIESQKKKKFAVRVCATYSRTWEIEASNYQEAEAQAAKELETNPLSKDDLDGEDWGSWEK